MPILKIHGTPADGHYDVQCDCGTTWRGQGEHDGPISWSPALPIAEASVHCRLAHAGASPYIVFSLDYEVWLRLYWEASAAATAAANAHASKSQPETPHGKF